MESSSPNSSLPVIKIAFLNVGQADTIVITAPSTKEAVVIDCFNADSVLDYLNQEQIKFLRGIIITHAHDDHVKGVPALIQNFGIVPGLQECEQLFFNPVLSASFLTNSSNLSKSLPGSNLEEVDEERSRAETYVHETTLRKLILWGKQNETRFHPLFANNTTVPVIGEISKSLTVLYPFYSDLYSIRDPNNLSLVIRVTGSGASALLAGDLETRGWQTLLTRPNIISNIQSDVLKFPHHGAWDSPDVSSFLNTINPSTVVISVGTMGEKKYDHPNNHVFSAIARNPKIKLLCTQGTGKCCTQDVLSNRSLIISEYEQEATTKSLPNPIIYKSGSPCAGSVIIELGDKVNILRPDIEFHKKRIIGQFYSQHKCQI